MSDDWDEETTTAQSFSFGGGGDVSSSDDSGFGSKSNGFGGGDRGFGKPSRGFGGRGRGSSGFGGREESNGFGDFEDKSSGFVGNKGFGSGRGGFKGRHRDDREDGESSGFGGGRGGGRGGFRGRRYDNENSENGESGRFGGGRSFGGSRDGFRGRPRDNENRDDGGSGFGGGTGFGGGRGGFRGRRRDNENGDDGSNGFGGGGGFGGSQSGFSGRRRDDNNEDSEGGGGGGKGFSGRGHNNEEDGGQDGEGRRRELYIPPAPPEDEDKLFETMAVGINFEKYDEIPVEVTGRDPPQYISTFDECDFFETTRKNIERCNYTRPTPVQKYAIPIIGTGRDLMACAQTGSGKTAAFLLPVITKLVRENLPGASAADSQSPEVLIISPTRELTLQIYNEARKFVHSSIYRPVVVYGGTSVGHQLRQLEMGCNILVATPGRLVDFLNRKKVLLDNLKVLILDEADRMLDMGFEPEIRKVVDQFNMPDKTSRQTLMFSATFPEDIQRLAGDFLNDHIFLTVGVVGGTTSDIQQRVVEVGDSDADKREKLQEILLESGTNRVLVFVETKRNADFLASLLCQENFPTTSIHGDRFQREREEALRDFRSGRSRVLVATSVAARGLDIPKVKHVINYDLPSSIDEYVHRIGRTGRIGNQGQATAFFQSHRDGALARALVKVLADAHQEVPEFLEQAAVAAVGTNYGPAGGKFASKDIRFQGSGRRGGNGGFKGDSSGFGNDDGGFGTGFEESSTGHFSSQPAVTEEEDW